MKLGDLLRAAGGLHRVGGGDPEISSISTDSRTVEPGCLFIAVPGYRDDGLRYVGDALCRGAAALMIEKPNRAAENVQVPVCYTASARKCALDIARAFHGYPSGAFHLTGVTGTNGKTTVTYLIEAFLKACGHRVGVVGTINYRYADVVVKAGNTIPDPLQLQSLFSRMQGRVSHAVMEVSSHALAMDRVHPGDFDAALFTNLSQDHLDFHPTMEDYFQAKARLFTGLPAQSHAVINLDDPYGRRLVRMCPAVVHTYGLSSAAGYSCTEYHLDITGSEFTVNGRSYRTHLVGAHNISNILAALAHAGVLGLPHEAVAGALGGVRSVPGRFERVGKGADFHVFVDYAHTPDALEHLLDTANRLKQARVITVFGCGGDRDRTKRPKMGEVVERWSDLCVVTSDNPRTEDPLAIIDDIKRGMNGSNAVIIPDRRSAIHHAVGLARRDDIVLIAGKGHEDYQILGEKRIHFDDREMALEAMRGRGAV
jgi:UDP-N-acetylmuramoyl-L-alanyl-D-glutamate--2,6-diaminopimelate ligase